MDATALSVGAAWVPSGAAKVEEREVRLLLPERMRVHAECQLRVAVAQLRGDPPNALSRRKGEARIRVARVVQPKGPDAFGLRVAAHSVPGAGHVPLAEAAARLGAEHELRDLLPASLQGFPPASGEQFSKRSD